MKNRLCGKNIEPCCRLCAMGRSMPDGQSVLCPRKGVMRMDDKCRRFSYDPLKRTPDVSPELPVYREEDFKIDSKT